MSREKYAKQDEQLYFHIRNMQAGRMDSYTEVYNLSAKYLYKIIYDIVQDYHTTEDMLQETFLKIYNNIGSLQNPEAYFVWAGRIATNLCVRYIHKYRKEILSTATEDGEGNEEFIFDTVADDNDMFIPESVLDNKEHQRMIGEVIDSLSVEQKLAVQCFYFEEMSVKEIATLMECSEGTIKSRLNYARKSIKESVLNIEKTQGTKLYSFGGIPVLLLLYKSMAQAAVPASAVAGTGAALAGMYGTGGSVAGAAVGGVNVAVGATVGGTTVASGAAVAAGISGKIAAIIASVVVGTVAIVGGTIWAVTETNKKEVYVDESTKSDAETLPLIDTDESTEDVGGNIHGDEIPLGGKYIVASTGKELKAGDKMSGAPEQDDCYYYEDYKYTYDYFGGGWKVELNDIEDYQSRTSFSEIIESISGVNIVDISKLFEGCSNMVETPKIPSGVLYMHRTFQECTLLEKVTNIPKGVIDISSAFRDCENIEEVPRIPSSVKNMDATFDGCISLTNTPNIPDGVTSLFDTFRYCEKLKKAPKLPEGIVNMSGTFSGCESLLEAPIIPDGVTSLCQTFERCKSLINPPDIPDGVTDMKGIFDGCSNLESAPRIPNGVIEMNFVIRGCRKITVAPVIPESVVDMTAAFQNCSGLTGEIIINANPLYYEQCFRGVDFETQGIELSGSSTMLEELKATSVFYETDEN